MQKRGGKAQVSMEYMLIVGFAVMATMPLVLVYYTYSNETNDQINLNQASQIAKRIVDSAESMYYLGNSSRTTIKVSMPNSIESIVIANKEVVFEMRTISGLSDIVAGASVNISGSLPNSPGVRYIKVESKGNYVDISS